MTFQQLSYALALQRFASFQQAAENIGISQPALSMQISKLEKETDLVLFDRSRRKIEVTEKGMVFLERAKIVIHEARQLKRLVRQMQDDYIGQLRIGVIPTLAPYLLPLFIEDLNRSYRNLKVYIREALTEEIIEDLKSGSLDGGIISTPISSKLRLESRPLFYEEFKLFVSRSHPLSGNKKIQVSDIPLEDIWLLREGNCFRDQVENICELARDQVSRGSFYFESSSIESLCRIVEFKGGVTFLPELTTMHLSTDREDMIRDLEGNKRVREISIIYMPGHIHEEDIMKIGSIIRKNLPKKLLTLGAAKTVSTKVNI